MSGFENEPFLHLPHDSGDPGAPSISRSSWHLPGPRLTGATAGCSLPSGVPQAEALPRLHGTPDGNQLRGEAGLPPVARDPGRAPHPADGCGSQLHQSAPSEGSVPGSPGPLETRLHSGGGTALQGSVRGSRHLQRALLAPVHLPPGDAASWKPMPLPRRTLGCKSVLSKVPPSPPGIKMNSYEVLPPAVDRKTLLKCESSVLGSRTKVGKERSRPPRGGGACLPQPHRHSEQGSREIPALARPDLPLATGDLRRTQPVTPRPCWGGEDYPVTPWLGQGAACCRPWLWCGTTPASAPGFSQAGWEDTSISSSDNLPFHLLLLQPLSWAGGEAHLGDFSEMLWVSLVNP